MKRWKLLLLCGAIAVLAAAVIHKNREVTGLREQARRAAAATAAPVFFGATKPRGERPAESSGDDFDDEDNELLAGMSAFLPGGDLSDAAIKCLGLTQEEAAAANRAIHRFRAEAQIDLAKRLKPTAEHSEGSSSRQRYYARARRDRGQGPFDGLTLALGSVVGQDRTRPLMKAFINDELSARVCKLDLELEVVLPEEEGEEVRVSYQLRSPRDGCVSLFHGGVPLADFEKEFGKLFDGPGTGAE